MMWNLMLAFNGHICNIILTWPKVVCFPSPKSITFIGSFTILFLGISALRKVVRGMMLIEDPPSMRPCLNLVPLTKASRYKGWLWIYEDGKSSLLNTKFLDWKEISPHVALNPQSCKRHQKDSANILLASWENPILLKNFLILSLLCIISINS